MMQKGMGSCSPDRTGALTTASCCRRETLNTIFGRLDAVGERQENERSGEKRLNIILAAHMIWERVRRQDTGGGCRDPDGQPH